MRAARQSSNAVPPLPDELSDEWCSGCELEPCHEPQLSLGREPSERLGLERSELQELPLEPCEEPNELPE
jgi:hypothetical protein